jgi:hypothetical protein
MFLGAITRNHQKLLVLYINMPVLYFCIVRCGLPIIVFYKMFVPVIIFDGVANPQSQCCLLERVGLQH